MPTSRKDIEAQLGSPSEGEEAGEFAHGEESSDRVAADADLSMLGAAQDDVLSSPAAGGKVIRGTAWRLASNLAGVLIGLGTATLLLRHLGVAESGRYVTVMSLVAIPGTLVETGLNVIGSRELAVRSALDRRRLIANVLGQRLLIGPVAMLAAVVFAVLAGYPERMVIGTAFAGTGLFLVSLATILLLPLIVALRNAEYAVVEVVRQATTLVGVAVLALLGATLAPFFAIQIIVGLVTIVLALLLTGRRAFLRPRLDRREQRTLFTRAIPLAAAIVFGQLYFRLVIVLMSLISAPKQTGYFAGSLRAMETLVNVPVLVASVALPLLAAAARDDRARLRRAVEGMGQGAVIAGVLVALVTARAAEPVIAIIGGPAFRPAGAVLRIQVISLLFIALYQIWTVALVALGRQRELILTNAVALLGVSGFAAALVPEFGAQGGALASVLGDALLASLIYWRIHLATGRVMVRASFLARVAAAAVVAGAVLLLPALPNLAVAALSGVVFLLVGWRLGMLPSAVIQELRRALHSRTPAARRDPK